LCADIHDQVCREGYNSKLGSFVQSYGSEALDASLLMMPLVGFLPPDDARVRGTIEAVQRGLIVDGFVRRYIPGSSADAIGDDEGAFLLCTFWLADNLALIGRESDAHEIFERLLDIRNDVGLLSEEYAPHTKRLLGNFPQAFSHVALINTAYCLQRAGGVHDRPRA
jgi:GH15 family glucan-1,4-alpha-glucosidase